MKLKWISRKNYVDPWIQSAKARGIKLSNKNLKRLDDCHCSWASKHYGMNGVFRHAYEENIEALICQPVINPFMRTIPKDTYVGQELKYIRGRK